MICSCPEQPRCEYHHCSAPADWSVWQPRWGTIPAARGSVKFMCGACWKIYRKAMTTPMRGIDRPEGADDEWRGSILDHLRHARIAMEFEDRNERRPRPAMNSDPRYYDDAKRFTPAQFEQIKIFRKSVERARKP